MKLGYPCINRTLDGNAAGTFRLASFTTERFLSTVKSNLNCLERILQYNAEQGFEFFRISSDTIPFATHPVNTCDWLHEFNADLKRIGAFIKKHRMRISMHPDQFVLINTPSPDILRKSVADLTYHASFLDAMGLDTTAKIQIHVGGVYGDKPAAMARFVAAYKELPSTIKRRLVIENDDRLFSLRDCMEIHAAIGIPILFDNFHHECLNNGELLSAALVSSSKTWKAEDGILMVDYSEQEPGARRGKHATSIDPKKFGDFLKAAKVDMDIMLEIKDKEASALRALPVLKSR